jgi:tetratricopeptide (TPR) repeat protein
VPAPVVAATNGGRNERFTVRPPAAGNTPATGNTSTAGNTAAASNVPAPFGSTETSPNNENKAEKGYIRIQVGPPQTTRPPVPVPAPAPAPASSPARRTAPRPEPRPDPMLRAQSLQAAGRYAEAVSAYQQALGGAAVLRGAGRGDAYQGMAASYQRMGNAAQARLAYQQAMTAYQAALSGPDAAAARQGVATCRAALEVLGDA